MEQPHSSANPTKPSALVKRTGERGFLNGAWSRDRDEEIFSPMRALVPFREPHQEPLAKVRTYDATPDIETPAAKQLILAGSNLVNAPISDYKNASDQQLLETARSSNEQAFVELIGRHAQMVQRKIFRILRNQEDTEDVVQEALFRAYAHLGEFRGTCAFSTWLTRIAINLALMLLRKRRLRTEVSFDQPRDCLQAWGDWEYPDSSPNAEQAYASRQTADLLARAVKRLPSRYRNVVEQYHGKERSLQEAADSLGITVAAAKSRLLRARLTIRSMLEESASPRRVPVTNKRGAFATEVVNGACDSV